MKKLVLTFLLVFVSALNAAENPKFPIGERPAHDIKRDKQSHGPDIVKWAGIKPGMKVADVLGGGGYYSEILSQSVGNSGQVYLHNNQAYMPYVEKELVARLTNNRLTNVIRHDKETDNLMLGENRFDAMFFILGYHDMYHVAKDWKIDKEDFLSQLKMALKPGGKLVVVDHSALDGSGIEHSQKLHRIDSKYVKNELISKGFKFVKSSDVLRNANDDRLISPFDPKIRRQTDRFIMLFEK